MGTFQFDILWGPLSYRAFVCVLIDVCAQLLLYMLRGQHKIIPQHSRSKSSTKPPSPFLTCQFKMATRPLLFSRHPIPSAIAKNAPYEPYTTYFDRPLQSTVFTTALIRLRQLINIGPQSVQNRRSVGSSRKENTRGVRDCRFNNIQASVTASCSKVRNCN